jgi:DTW domain-containing protein YfiP
MTACFCFAESRLQQLYEQAGFCHIEDSAETLNWVWKSYQIIAKRMKRKHQYMQLFVKDLTNAELQTYEAIDVILLQHVKERPRVTSTAQLLSDNDYLKKNETFWSLLDRVKVEVWSWSGRMDNQKIERQLEQIHQGTVLVWTGGNTSAYPYTSTTTNPPSFVILDGTWQEARTMFRKLPILQQLPRFSISSQWSSTYTLRKDFTGWRDRFRGSDENLLCTAEVVAALLDHRGDTVGRDIIRNRLQEFQREFDKK